MKSRKFLYRLLLEAESFISWAYKEARWALKTQIIILKFFIYWMVLGILSTSLAFMLSSWKEQQYSAQSAKELL